MSKRDKDNLMRYAKIRNKRSDFKYLELYRAIEAQQIYDENTLKESLDFKHFSEAKKHLSNLILRVLRIYDTHPETEMQNRLAEIRLLLDRSLYHFAMKKIRQAREIAVLEERFDALHTLADYALVALPFVFKPRELSARRETVVASRDEAFRNLDTMRKLKDIQDKPIAAVIDEASQSGRFSAELVREIEAHPQLLIPDDELPARAQSTKYRIWNVIRHQQLDFEGRAEVLSRMIAVFESHDFLIEEEPVRYVFALGGYGMCLNVIGRYDAALKATLKLMQLKSDKANIMRAVFLNVATNLCSYTLNTGDITPINKRMPQLLNALKIHRDSTPQPTLAYIHYLFAIVYWCSGDIRLANRFARRVLNAPAGRINLQAACKCFLLIFAYEQGDPDLIFQYARTWRRLWKQNAPRYEIERSFVNFMTAFVDLTDPAEKREALATYKDEIADWLSGGFEVRADNFVFIVHWLKAKISGQELVDVVRDEAK